MKSLFGNVVLEIQNNVGSLESTSVLVSPFDGIKSSSELPSIIYRGINATTFDVNLTWSRSAASLLGFLIANFPFNSSFSSVSLSIPPVEQILETGVYCFKVRIYPVESLSEFDLTSADSFMIEVTDLKAGNVIVSGALTLELISKLSEMHSISVTNIGD